MQAQAQDIDRRLQQRAIGDQRHQRLQGGMGRPEVPAAIYYQGREWLGALQQHVDGLARLVERWVVQSAFLEYRRIARRKQPRVALARRDAQMFSELQQHVAAGRRTAALHEAYVPLRDFGLQCEIELT